MKKIFLSSVISTLLLLSACNNTLTEPRSFSLVKKENLRDPSLTKKVKAKIEKDEFVDLKVDDFKEIQAYLAGERPIEEKHAVDFRVLMYRFYSQVKVEGGNLVCSARSGSEIGISEDVFQLYKAELSRLNDDITKMKEGDRLDEETLRKNLEEQVKQLIE